MKKHACTSTPHEPIDDSSWQPQHCSQWYLALSVPGTRLKTRNASDAHLYCNRQLLKKFHRSNEPHKFNTTQFLCKLFFTFPIYIIYIHISSNNNKVVSLLPQQCSTRCTNLCLSIYPPTSFASYFSWAGWWRSSVGKRRETTPDACLRIAAPWQLGPGEGPCFSQGIPLPRTPPVRRWQW